MSKLAMWNLITLDGFFEGEKSWDLDWHQLVLGPEFEDFAIAQLKSCDRLIFGRVTYEGMAAYWSNAQGEIADLMNRLPKVVFSRTLQNPEWQNTIVATSDLVDQVRALKEDGQGYSLVVGSGSLSRSLMSYNLFDEYRILIAPIILGNGNLLFGNKLARHNLKLKETRNLARGAVILFYEPAETGSTCVET